MQESVINDKTSHHSNLSLEPDPILFGKLAGRQEIRLKLKQSEGVMGPKVDLEVNLGSLTTFLSARQLHVLIELLHGLATPDLEDTRYWKCMGNKYDKIIVLRYIALGKKNCLAAQCDPEVCHRTFVVC
jgi:hypothetical protein